MFKILIKNMIKVFIYPFRVMKSILEIKCFLKEFFDVKLNYIFNNQNAIKTILIENYINDNLHKNVKYTNDKKLNKYEFQVYSQHGEDGIIEEIFNRIGSTNKYFVEFGAEKGLENNTLFLLIKNWRGSWIEGNDEYVRFIKNKFEFLLQKGALSVIQSFITAENIEDTFRILSVPSEFDLLSIDIDGNDYWVWKAIKNYSPRVVVIEYNAIFRPPTQYVIKYEPFKKFEITRSFGASLQSLYLLAEEKGYKLVACNFAGGNAFFVRSDLVREHFMFPFTAENHYEPPRYYLERILGHRRDFAGFNNS